MKKAILIMIMLLAPAVCSEAVENRVVKTYSLEDGKVLITATLEVKNIDTDEWVPVRRDVQKTGKTKAEFKQSLLSEKKAIADERQAEIDKVDATQ